MMCDSRGVSDSERAPEAARHRRIPGILLAGAAALVAAAALVFFGMGNLTDAPESADDPVGPTAVHEPTEQLTDLPERAAADPLAIGSTDAPVTMVVLSDYQCPYCAQWHENTLPNLQIYVETDDLRIEWRDTVVYGPASERAARAAFAAARQGAFREFQDALFDGGEARSEDELSDEALLAVAGALGLDTAQFTADFNSDAASASVADDATIATSLGVYATPAFIIDGQPILGAQPTSVFVDALEQAIAAGRP